MVPPPPFAWPYAVIFWPVYLWVFLPEWRIVRHARQAAPTSAHDKGSLRVLMIGFNLAVLSAFALPFASPWAALPGPRGIWFALGVVLLVAGGLLRRHCFRVLGRFFTGTVEIHPDQRVVDTGAYRFVRHPSYSAALLLVVGTALAAGNWLGATVSFFVALVSYAYRARVEERALLAALGEPYAAFLSTRKRFIPYVY